MGDTNLNKLLEDALDDLLLEDVPQPPPPSADNSVSESEKATASGSPGKSSKHSHTGGDSSPAVTAKPKRSNNQGPKQPKTSSSMMVDEKEMDKFFASMTEKLNSEMPKIDPSESVPQIMDLMQNLLSKELLYPALKDLSPKFDEWLERNSASLDKDERKRYKRQLSKIREIIDVFDNESLEERERFEKNLELMEQMQSLGAPPEELTVPDGMSKCSIM